MESRDILEVNMTSSCWWITCGLMKESNISNITAKFYLTYPDRWYPLLIEEIVEDQVWAGTVLEFTFAYFGF